MSHHVIVRLEILLFPTSCVFVYYSPREAGMADVGNHTGRPSEAVVSENLKTLRLLHQLLMVVAAAVLAFALRSDPSNDYKLALEELSALREVPFDGWTRFVADHYKTVGFQNEKFARRLVRQAGLPITGQPTLGPSICAPQAPRALFPESRLLEFDAFLSGNQTIGAFKMGAVDREYTVKHLKELVASRNPHPSVSNMYVNLGGPGADCGNASGNTATLNFQINDQPQTIPNQPIYVIVTYSVVSESGHFAADWLKTDAFGQKLIDRRSGQIFPHVKLFWERVSLLTPEQATAFLEQQLESSAHGTLSFFGIPVERQLAVPAGPVVCFAILLFLCLHLRHFRLMARERNCSKYFPWVPLFRNAPGALIVTYVTLLILPVLANEELLRRFGDIHEGSSKLGVAFAALLLGVGLWTLVEVHLLRRGQAISSITTFSTPVSPDDDSEPIPGA
jgi:hypothetical protein